jgi:ABC-type nitrate/sulfonate/bicarbonate transport system substrate-binding protein
MRTLIVLLVLIPLFPCLAQERFSSLVGPVRVGTVQESDQIQVPWLTWGADVATFEANGGLTTQSGSTYAELGLKLNLVQGDDFIVQVKNYMEGKTPFLRGTTHMLGMASEVLGSDPRTKPVIILQLSWSAGDHIVSRSNIRTLNDLKGKKIAVQQGGPHVGLLFDSLRAANLSKNDVQIVWVKELTGPNGAAEAFRKDSSIGACCVITPDMIGLTGGFDSTGSGAEGTVEGAHILNSTQQMSRSIADVYAVRADWYKANKQTVEKFVAGYLAGTERVVKLRKEFEETNRLSDRYRIVLKMAQTAFGTDVLPTLEVDAHGLLLDSNFVGLPGQISFFNDSGNLNGFDPKSSDALELAVTWGYATSRSGFDPSGLDYKKIAEIAKIQYVEPDSSRTRIRAESIDVFPDSNLDDRTIVDFTISFEPNQVGFSTDRYGAEFDRALKSASTFGNAIVVVRGHSDPTKTLVDLIKSGMQKGIITRTGQTGNYRYFINGKEIDLSQTEVVVKLIRSGVFDGTDPNPRDTMQAALNLSLSRAEEVRATLTSYAKAKGVNLDASQIQPVGAGITEPVIARPKDLDEAKQNMRVEFKIVKVPAEALDTKDFDY